MEYVQLKSPISIGTMHLKNRFIMAATSCRLCTEDGYVTEDLKAFYEARAKGGFSLIVTEFCSVVLPEGNATRQISIADDSYVSGLKSLVEVVHKHDCKIAVQLMHAGSFAPPEIAKSVSTVPFNKGMKPPTALTRDGVYALIDTFVAAAKRAKEAGFDAVEVHATHGFLLNEFVSPRLNRRVDEFGGSFENRVRVVTNIIQGIKETCGNDYPVLVRWNPDEMWPDGLRPKESAVLATLIERAGADCISLSSGLYGTGVGHCGYDSGYNLPGAEEMKKVLKIPVAVVGKLKDPDFCEAVLQSGAADLIAMSRAALADPEFPNKVFAGRADEITPCNSCLQRCMLDNFGHGDGRLHSCVVNPFCMRETRLIQTPAEAVKNIMVVGAGPAGLQFAMLAAERGHKVTVYEKNALPGGQYRAAAMAPFKQDTARIIAHWVSACKRNGVEIIYNTEVTPELIREQKADSVVLCTGGVPNYPEILGLKEAKPIPAVDVLFGCQVTGTNILILGGGQVGVETADYLGQYGYRCTIVEREKDIAPELYAYIRSSMKERLTKQNATIVTDVEINTVLPDSVVFTRNGRKEVLDGFDNVVLALGSESYNPLEDAVRGICDEVYVIGDARKAGQALDAIYYATILALKI